MSHVWQIDPWLPHMWNLPEDRHFWIPSGRAGSQKVNDAQGTALGNMQALACDIISPLTKGVAIFAVIVSLKRSCAAVLVIGKKLQYWPIIGPSIPI